jgi:hypothetical protein
LEILALRMRVAVRRRSGNDVRVPGRPTLLDDRSYRVVLA